MSRLQPVIIRTGDGHEPALLALVSAALVFVHAAPMQAQSLRTWVSGVGDDANPCSRTAPCKTFAGAISKTAAGGEISVLDPGGYGVVPITKSISIVAVGAEGGVATTGDGITIKAGAGDFVTLDGLVIQGNNSGTAAITVASAARVHISNCKITGFLGDPGIAIKVASNDRTQVFVSNCTLFSNNVGVEVDGNAIVYLINSSILGNKTGLQTQNDGQIVSLGTTVLPGHTAKRP